MTSKEFPEFPELPRELQSSHQDLSQAPTVARNIHHRQLTESSTRHQETPLHLTKSPQVISLKAQEPLVEFNNLRN